MNQVSTVQIFITQNTEYKINNGGRRLDVRMLYKTGRLKPCKDKFLYKFFHWHTVLQSDGDRNSKAVQHTTHGCAFLRHVNKDLSYCSIGIFSCTKENCLSIDLGLLSETSSFSGQRTAFNYTCQFAFQLGIWRRLYSLLHFVQ